MGARVVSSVPDCEFGGMVGCGFAEGISVGAGSVR